MKKIAIIPTLMTLGNAVCGFAAIAYAGKIGLINAGANDDYYFYLSGWLIVIAMIFDALDGYVARLARSTSRFGGELDSLCDAISFGAAPAFILLRLGPGWDRPVFHQTLAVVATLYMVCAVLRLARYNVDPLSETDSGSKRFRGLPSPAAAGCLAALAILRGGLGQRWGFDPIAVQMTIEAWATLGAFLLALLMVSRVPYPHLTKYLFRGRRHFDHLMLLIFGAFLIAIAQEMALALLFWGYVLGTLGHAVWVRTRRPVPFVSVPVDDTVTR